MLIEFDLLIAAAAMMLLLPVAIFQFLGNQSTFSKSSILFSEGLIANADTQRLLFLLGGASAQPADLTQLMNSSNSDYQSSLTPYDSSGTYARQGSALSRLVVLGGKVYYLTVGR